MYKDSDFFHILTNTCFHISFIIIFIGRMQWYLKMIFFSFPEWFIMANSFSAAYSALIYIWRNLYSNPLPILNWVVFCCWLFKFFLYSGYEQHIGYMICKYFFSFHRCSSIFTYFKISLGRFPLILKSSLLWLLNCLEILNQELI